MNHALVITRSWSDSPETATHGVFQRLSLFLDALATQCPHIEMLVFAPNSADLMSLAIRHANRYRRGNVGSINVTAIPRVPNPANWGNINRYLGGAFSVDRQENYLNIAGPSCVQALRDALQKRPSLIFAHRLPVFTPLLQLMSEALPPILFDMDDIEHRALIRGLIHAPRWPSDRLRFLHVPALILRERQAVQISQHTFVCSEEDARAVQRVAASSRVAAIPNAVAAPNVFAERTSAGGYTFGFIGSFAHPPNLDAAIWLITEIWPRIRLAQPRSILHIAGPGSSLALSSYAGTPGLKVLDFVEDIGSFYSDVDVMLAPLRFGAGTRVKIIEAAGYGVPTISTSLGAEGLVFIPDEEIILADAADRIASESCRLIDDQYLARRIGRAARSRYELQYGRPKAVEDIAGYVRRVLAPSPGN